MSVTQCRFTTNPTTEGPGNLWLPRNSDARDTAELHWRSREGQLILSNRPKWRARGGVSVTNWIHSGGWPAALQSGTQKYIRAWACAYMACWMPVYRAAATEVRLDPSGHIGFFLEADAAISPFGPDERYRRVSDTHFLPRGTHPPITAPLPHMYLG